MLSARQRTAFHKGTDKSGRPLSSSQKDSIITPFLPSQVASTQASSQSTTPFQSRSASRKRSTKNLTRERKKPIRSLLKQWVYVFIYTIIHAFFSIYVRCRKSVRAVKHRMYAIGHYHHRTPELIRSDVKNFSRIPTHLSVIVELDHEEDRRTALKKLLADVGDLTSWCACIGIPMLSIYERTGILKRIIPQTHDSIKATLTSYFPPDHRPALSLRAPHEPAFSPPPSPSPAPSLINVLLLSEEDGRSTMVDLTRVLATMVQKNKIKLDDITTELVDAELADIVMDEPQLLILFGPRVVLQGYPPWQVRLTEIFHVPDYTEGVSYPLFIKALDQHASAEKRFGK